jgi:hypothetical protein
MATYMQFTQTTTLAGLERLKDSRNGNPRFRVVLSNGQIGKTKTDSGFTYGICDSWVGKRVRAQYRVTNSGNLMFTDLSLADS